MLKRYVLVCDLVDLSSDQIEVGVNLCLVVLVDFGQSEERHEAEDDECESVEPRAQVGQNVENEPELEGVDQVFDEEPATELRDGRVDVRYRHVCRVTHALRAQGQVHVQVLSESTKSAL